MAELKSEKLYEFLRDKARQGERTTAQQVARRFGADLAACEHRLALLAGSCVLRAIPGTPEFDCANVLHVTLAQFESAVSHGNHAPAFIEALFARIKRLTENNARLRSRVDTLNAELTALRNRP